MIWTGERESFLCNKNTTFKEVDLSDTSSFFHCHVIYPPTPVHVSWQN